jgi:hypothetical protein
MQDRRRPSQNDAAMAKVPPLARAMQVFSRLRKFTIYESETNRVNHQSQIANYRRCPIFSRFAFKYRSLCGLGFTRIGNCSTIFSP